MSLCMTQDKILNCTLGGLYYYLCPYFFSFKLFSFNIINYFFQKINTQILKINLFSKTIEYLLENFVLQLSKIKGFILELS